MTVEVDRDVAREAAAIRRKYGFRLLDAVQLATAKLNKAQIFVSNDKGLQKFKELKVIALGKA